MKCYRNKNNFLTQAVKKFLLKLLGDGGEKRTEKKPLVWVHYNFSTLVRGGVTTLVNKGCKEFFAKLRWCLLAKLAEEKGITAEAILSSKFANTSSINTLVSEKKTLRVNLLIDTLSDSCLFSHASIALIFATHLAKHLSCPLRIITRIGEKNLLHFHRLCRFNRLNIPCQVSAYNFTYNSTKCLEIGYGDVFVSTSWWNSLVVREINMRSHYICLFQEFDSLFCTDGDEQFLAKQVLHDEYMIPIASSKGLFDYFSSNNYQQFKKTRLFFEPAFPNCLYHPNRNTFKRKSKFRLFFHARPSVPKNLFHIGLMLINAAIDMGVLDTSRWNICFGGEKLDYEVIFSDGSKAQMLGSLDHDAYIKLARTIDLSICLHYTPSINYLSLAFAASGAVVLTNNYANEENIVHSENIVCSRPDMVELLNSLKVAVNLATCYEQRKINFQENEINPSWDSSFDKMIEKVSEILLDSDHGGKISRSTAT